MYSNLFEYLNNQYNELKNFTGDYLKQYTFKKRLFDVYDLDYAEDLIEINKKYSEAKRRAIYVYDGDLLKHMFECEIEYYDKVLEQLSDFSKKIYDLPNYTVNFISKDLNSLERSLKNNEIDKLAKMIVIESNKEDGCILHFNEKRNGDYADHEEDHFYEYICSTCDTDCFKNDGEDVKDYKSSHFIHLSDEEIREHILDKLYDKYK